MAQGAPPSPLQPCPESYSRRWAPPSGWRKTCSPPIRLVAIVTQPSHFSPMGEELPGRAERKGPSMGFFGDTHPSLCVPSPEAQRRTLGKELSWGRGWAWGETAGILLRAGLGEPLSSWLRAPDFDQSSSAWPLRRGQVCLALALGWVGKLWRNQSGLPACCAGPRDPGDAGFTASRL